MTTNSLYDTVLSNKAKIKKHRREFREIFGIDLNNYYDIIIGFDVIAFDEKFIQPAEGQSTHDKVNEKYGARAVDLVLELLKGI